MKRPSTLSTALQLPVSNKLGSLSLPVENPESTRATDIGSAGTLREPSTYKYVITDRLGQGGKGAREQGGLLFSVPSRPVLTRSDDTGPRGAPQTTGGWDGNRDRDSGGAIFGEARRRWDGERAEGRGHSAKTSTAPGMMDRSPNSASLLLLATADH
jgi:hypothetical protein